jgi:exopolyphosphatase/guanosine-5'-triphosphate,3'-diphosphate pyrophosphatase
MPALAAIDVGSNAMRLAIAEVDGQGTLRDVENAREAVRLGAEVFSSGAISPDSIQRSVKALLRFRDRIDACQALHVRAVATSAVREARNRAEFVGRVHDATGIALEAITGEEEARLVFLAVSGRVDLADRLAMLIDIGGGSVEVSIAENGVLSASASFKMGAVRLLELLGRDDRGVERFLQMAGEYVEGIRRHVRRQVGDRRIGICLGTGGNIETLADLRNQLLGQRDDAPLKTGELEQVLAHLRGLTVAERIDRLGLRPDRADVVVPAAMVLHRVLTEAGVGQVLVPRVGLKEGVLAELAHQVHGSPVARRRDQVLASAQRLGRRCQFDEDHARTVAHMATWIFDATSALHGLGADHRMLLEAAATLHDVGQFVNMTGHHKHSYHLIRNAPLVGLAENEKEIVANTARYHRKSLPKPEHETYRALAEGDRRLVDRLAAILRIADAMDVEHGGKVEEALVQRRDRRVTFRIDGRDDLLLEQWAVARKSKLFEKAFDVEVVVERGPRALASTTGSPVERAADGNGEDG